jgi:enoyl-CoA hydratase/carnithine racemase
MSQPAPIQVTPHSEHVAVVTINRPHVRNATDRETGALLDAALTDAEQRGLRCLVLTGAGEVAFCAGNDISELTQLSSDQVCELNEQRQRWTWHWMTTPVVTIAALNGLAYGNGAILAMSADLRVGSRQSCMKVTATGLGGANDTWILPSLIGWSAAKDILLTGRQVPAEELRAMGLLNRLVDPEHVQATALALADQIAAHPPSGVQAVKRLIHESAGLPLRERFDREAAVQAAYLGANDLSDLSSRPETDDDRRSQVVNTASVHSVDVDAGQAKDRLV